ncbi:hypothetical protein BS17DRAFT_769406 [Gyrodon lividus]|nr:hypothetical protein BS17DRAFT_769406 [Gyrodon lividus]
MSSPQIDALLDLWPASLLKHGDKPPFAHHHHLYKAIDSTPLGDIKWQNFSVTYTSKIPTTNPPPWMQEKYKVWFWDPRAVSHRIIANPSFVSEMDFRPFHNYSTEGDVRQFQDFMSSDWAWDQVSTFVPIILGSNKTTVSVGTGSNEFYPLYLSIGNVWNNVRCTYQDVLVLIAFLARPKNYKEQALLTCIVQGWCPICQATQENWDANAQTHCREFQEYLFKENSFQVLWDKYGIVGDLIPFTNDFPCANIHQLIAPNILHQLIKGCFKDHLVDWVKWWLKANHSRCEAERIFKLC